MRRLSLPQLRLVGDKPARIRGVARHEDAERDLQAFDYAAMERRELGRAFRRELQLALDFLGRDFGEILVDDVTHVLEIDVERD